MKRVLKVILFIFFSLRTFPISAETPDTRNFNLTTSQLPTKEASISINELKNELEIIAEMIVRDEPPIWISDRWGKFLTKNKQLDLQTALKYIKQQAQLKWDLYYRDQNRLIKTRDFTQRTTRDNYLEQQEFAQRLSSLVKSLYDTARDREIGNSSLGGEK